MMKQSRKNPFGQATDYQAPARAQGPFETEIQEDPAFSDFSEAPSSFQQQPNFVQNRAKNPFGQPPAQFDAHAYQSYQEPEPQQDAHNFGGFGNPSFSNSGWSAPANTRQQPFSQSNMNDFNTNSFSSSGFGDPKMYGAPGDAQMMDEYSEPPLLEDLGIDLKQISRKILSIISLRKVNKEIVDDADLSGPLLIAIIFGTILLLRGKVQFGYIYGFGLTGCIGIFCLLKAMIAKDKPLDLYTIMSVLGYCLLPFTILATVTIFLPVFNIPGAVFSLAIILWSTYMATQFIDAMLTMTGKRMIIAYPIFLFYMCFLLLAIF